MRHAGHETFEELQGLLSELRSIPGLVERSTGTFYRRSNAFLHFHQDPDGPFADLQVEPEEGFVRLRMATPGERSRLLRTVRSVAHS